MELARGSARVICRHWTWPGSPPARERKNHRGSEKGAREPHREREKENSLSVSTRRVVRRCFLLLLRLLLFIIGAVWHDFQLMARDDDGAVHLFPQRRIITGSIASVGKCGFDFVHVRVSSFFFFFFSLLSGFSRACTVSLTSRNFEADWRTSEALWAHLQIRELFREKYI